MTRQDTTPMAQGSEKATKATKGLFQSALRPQDPLRAGTARAGILQDALEQLFFNSENLETGLTL